MTPLHVGLIGDCSRDVIAHQAIPSALRIAGALLGAPVQETWLPTAALAEQGAIDLARFDGLWSVPATPYHSTEGALAAITFAREQRVPFLGTCGGFQHAVLEYARNVLGKTKASHAELDPAGAEPIVAELACSMVEVDGTIHFRTGSRFAAIYGGPSIVERYHCRYGMNPAYVPWFAGARMAVAGVDDAGEPRAVELNGHPFFFGTAYQPERSALEGRPHPLVVAFVRALSK